MDYAPIASKINGSEILLKITWSLHRWDDTYLSPTKTQPPKSYENCFSAYEVLNADNVVFNVTKINFVLYNSPKIDILKKSHKNHHKCSWKIFYLDLHAVYSTTEINWMIYMHLAYMYIVSYANVRLKGDRKSVV